MWGTRFGTFEGTSLTLLARNGELVEGHNGMQHAEAQRRAVLGADFSYSARIRVDSAVDAHLQFRICDEGRYGIRLRTDGIVFYCFRREKRPCSKIDPSVVAHCPAWECPRDDPSWLELRSVQLPLSSGSRHDLEIRAHGASFDVLLDGRLIFGRPVEDDSFAVGRFGVYVWGDAASLSRLIFAGIRATTDPTQHSNFALLYSTAGYEALGTKRALVRTLNDLPSEFFDAERSRFTLRRSDGLPMRGGPLRAVPARSGSPDTIGKTFGMQLWEADFSSVTSQGMYLLRVEFATVDGLRELSSAPFEIRHGLVSSRMLRPLSILNAGARRAADEDFWRNWIQESGSWSVAVDGAFIADRANAQEGAVLLRVFNRNNAPLHMTNFRFACRITVVSGCDAQMQFRITPTERWAVTLQAGKVGGCAFGGGPGAIRLHREVPHEPPEQRFQIVAAELFPLRDHSGNRNRFFRTGQAYDLEIVARGDRVSVLVDGIVQLDSIPVPERHGGFGLKAWASTVRFERAQLWAADANLALSPEGSRIPMHENRPCWEAVPSDPKLAEEEPLQTKFNPEGSQLTGFQDCNNIIGEATSHGAFLAGLMEVWSRRSHLFSQADREALRRAIITATLYLNELYQQRNASGEYAHSEIGRVAIYTNLGPHNTLLALYGDSAFADNGNLIDRTLAGTACQRAINAAKWLWPDDELHDPVAQSVIYARIARSAKREELVSLATIEAYWKLAFDAVEKVLSHFSVREQVASEFRDTGRVIPWFEGVYEVLRSYPERRDSYLDRLNAIANILLSHLTTANGFFAMPQASGDPAKDSDLPKQNWEQMHDVPRVNRSLRDHFRHFYEGNHFAVAASEAVYLGQITGRSDIERIASGNLYWMLGLNPGIPASKVVRHPGGDGTPWGAACFVYNGGAPFARTMEAHRTNASSAKGWIAPWEVSPDSPHRETWWIDPQNRSVAPPDREFQSIVNGHVIWDEQWDYWNTGEFGWLSAETFLRNDGTFLKAAILYEDWLSGTTRHPFNPYNTGRFEFFDTSHLDRKNTSWGFDDPNVTGFAQASRAAHEFGVGKGFNGGRCTGHHVGEKLGVLCVPATANFFDATDAEILNTGWGFGDINLAHWAQVSRAATGFANSRGYVAGFFTGHQVTDRRGILCLRGDIAQWFDATDTDVFNSGEGFGDINTVSWAKAARAATNICLGRGFVGGFLTGHQIPGNVGVVGFIR